MNMNFKNLFFALFALIVTLIMTVFIYELLTGVDYTLSNYNLSNIPSTNNVATQVNAVNLVTARDVDNVTTNLTTGSDNGNFTISFGPVSDTPMIWIIPVGIVGGALFCGGLYLICKYSGCLGVSSSTSPENIEMSRMLLIYILTNTKTY